jgi:hypothetical protein
MLATLSATHSREGEEAGEECGGGGGMGGEATPGVSAYLKTYEYMRLKRQEETCNAASASGFHV